METATCDGSHSLAWRRLALAGCDPSKPVSVENRPIIVEPTPVQPAPPAAVEVGGPQGGIHVNDPAGGTKVDIGGGNGVRVKTPDSTVVVP